MPLRFTGYRYDIIYLCGMFPAGKCTMRFDNIEKKALRHALKDFEGEVYLFGSRTDKSRQGGDIDLLLMPQKRHSPLKLALEIQKRFFSICEEDIDVIIYRESPFCKEILKNARRLDIKRI